MKIEITEAGWTALWAWVQERARFPDTQSPEQWRKQAVVSLSLFDPADSPAVYMRGAVSKSGHLEALPFKSGWFHRIETARPTVAAASGVSNDELAQALAAMA